MRQNINALKQLRLEYEHTVTNSIELQLSILGSRNKRRGDYE